MIKKWFKYYVLGTSIKEMELNRILEKISKKENLSEREDNFLTLYNETKDSDLLDYSHLSMLDTFERIKTILAKNKKIYCEICDDDGCINERIIECVDDFVLNMKTKTHQLSDNFLYNINYNIKNDTYTLTQQDEYYEKINIEK